MNKFLILVLLLLFQFVLSAQSNDAASLDINNIYITFSNNGLLNSSNSDVSWKIPAGIRRIIFDHSICLSGKISNNSIAAFSQWHSVFCPGPLNNGTSVFLTDSINYSKYGIFKVTPKFGMPSPGAYTWPEEFGAPVKNGKPFMHGDQMVWTVYGFDTAFANNSRISEWWKEDFLPFPVEIHQLAYAHEGNLSDSENILHNVIFIEWMLINKGYNNIDSFYISLFTDIDLDSNVDNYFAIDTTLQTGFMWDSNSDDYPAVGYTLLYGPVIKSPGNSAIFKGNTLTGFKNIGLSSFHPISDDSDPTDLGPAASTQEAWNISRGFKPDGNKWFDPFTLEETKFPFAGNPLSGDFKWVNPGTGGGAGFILTTGPITLTASDSQWVMIAIVPGFDGTSTGSINEVRRKAEYLRSLQYSDLAFSKIDYDTVKPVIPNTIQQYGLEQNYPNPFNSYTNFSYSIPENESNIHVTLTLYDILGNKMYEAVNETKSSGKYKVRINSDNLASGVYIAEFRAGSFMSNKKIVLLK